MTVLIIGAGPMQVPAIRLVREMGWFCAAADGNASAAGASLADRFYHIDLKDREGLERACDECAAARGLDAIFTAGTDFSAIVSHLANRLGLPGHTPEAAIRASDKLRMRAALDAAGVPSPRFVEVNSPENSLFLCTKLGYPLVVKPTDSMGARGCRAVHSSAELAEAICLALPFSRTGRAIVEEYIEGPEFSVDALLCDGQIRIRGLADRHISFAPYFVELGHTMPSAFPEEIQTEVLRVFKLGVQALGLSHGAAKGDIKWCPSRGCAVVGEIAARLSGGYMSGWTYPYASGIEVTKEALLLAAGQKLGIEPSNRGWFSAERAFISIPGRVNSLVGARTVESAPYIKNLLPRVQPGDRVVFPRNNVEKCGNVISQAPTRKAAAQAAEDAIRHILVRLEAPNVDTEAFLSGQGRELSSEGHIWPPDAFALPQSLEEAISEIEAVNIAQTATLGLGVEKLYIPALDLSAAEKMPPDWSGRSFRESALLALELGRAELDTGSTSDTRSGKARVLGGRFWRALARGGAQAALYVLDCERKCEYKS